MKKNIFYQKASSIVNLLSKLNESQNIVFKIHFNGKLPLRGCFHIEQLFMLCFSCGISPSNTRGLQGTS